MKKKIILFCIVLLIIVLVLGAGIIMFNHSKNDDKEKNEVATNSSKEENSVKNEEKDDEEEEEKEEDEIDLEQMYADYLEANIFGEEDEVNGVYVDCNGDDYAELIIKHEKNTKLKVLYLDGDSIQESDDYENSNLALLYDVEDEEPHYCILNGDNYTLIEEVIGNKKIQTLSEKDSEFKYTYVKADITSSFYTISSDSTFDDVKKVKSKSKELITKDIEETASAEIKDIKDSELTKTDTGISNNKYSIAFGKYVYNDSSMTINADYSLVGEAPGYQNSSSGSYDIFHDTITKTGYIWGTHLYTDSFTIVDNNILQDDRGRKWVLQQ